MRRALTALTFAVGLAAWQAPAAIGADSIYWGTQTGAIRLGALNGSGSASSLYSGETSVTGIALNPSAGKLYWGIAQDPAPIRVGNLDGSGSRSDLFSGEHSPDGLAIDPAAGKIYWVNDTGTIRVANLDGSGSPQTLFQNQTNISSVAIDPTAGKIYWTIYTPGAIRVGNLDGSGSPQTLFGTESAPLGVAVDPASGKLYWASGNNAISGAIRVGNANGTGSPQTLFPNESYPSGVAVDPSAGKIYWGSNTTPAAIRVGNLDGSGSAQTLFGGENFLDYLSVLRSPLGTGAPNVSGGSSVGSTLSCAGASWASDLVGGFLYRSPLSFAYQWTRNGADIAGATSSSYTASASGSYACRATASNQAGSASQTSAAHPVSDLLSAVSQSHRRWREGSGLPHIASARPPVGTTFRFTLNELVRLRFAFTQRLPGRRVGGRCVALTAKNRSKPVCTRLVTRGTRVFAFGAGAHRLRFQGRLSKHKRLPIGRYTLMLTATNSAGQRASGKLTFTIVKG